MLLSSLLLLAIRLSAGLDAQRLPRRALAQGD
jgi:hypothetical protein